MRYIILLLLCSTAVAEQTGPHYISFPSFCDVYELYYDGENITGKEIGCGRDVNEAVTGKFVTVKTNLRPNGKVSRYTETVMHKEIQFIAEDVLYSDVLMDSGISNLYIGETRDYLVGAKYLESEINPLLEQ